MVELRNKIIDSISYLDNIKYLSKCDIDDTKLQNSYREIYTVLNYYCPESTFSNVIIKQLATVFCYKCVELEKKLYPYIFSELLQRMRAVECNKPRYKPFNRKNSPLKGFNLYHVHHSLNFEMVFNFKRYFEQIYKHDEQINFKIKELEIMYPSRTDYFSIFVRSEFINSVEWNEDNKTGEWLVYQIVEGKVHFLALALHETTDQYLIDLIKPYLK